jgi:hypothetical protein
LLDALTIGSTPITLDDDISDINGISSPKQSRFFKHDNGKMKKYVLASIASLVQQGDPCPNRSPSTSNSNSTSNSTSLVYPTGKSVLLNAYELFETVFLLI